MIEANEQPIERHPWEPFIPEGMRVLMLGTFPPGQHRWSMNFYYPNRTNDFWKIFGLIFCGDSNALVDTANKSFHLDAIRALLTEHKIGLADSAVRARRLKGNASDKFLEIVEVLNLDAIIDSQPNLTDIAAAGEKAATTLASITGTPVPRVGQYVNYRRADGREIKLWRLPSSSRAYPMALGQKAETYKKFFASAGILNI